MFQGLKMERMSWLNLTFFFFFFLFPQVNGTEIEYEFEEITLERVSVSDPTAAFDLSKSTRTRFASAAELHVLLKALSCAAKPQKTEVKPSPLLHKAMCAHWSVCVYIYSSWNGWNDLWAGADVAHSWHELVKWISKSLRQKQQLSEPHYNVIGQQ